MSSQQKTGSYFTDRNDNEVRSADELDVVGAQFGLKFTSGGLPDGLVELYTEDDGNYFFIDSFNHLWISDMIQVMQKAKEHFEKK